jgi:hypothetical protein
MFSIEKSINLLKDGMYTDVIDHPGYKIIKSIFKESVYNYIFPKTNPENIDFELVENELASFKSAGFEFAYYIDSTLMDDFENLINQQALKLQYTDRYVYLENPKPYEVEAKEVVELTSSNLDAFIEATEICFPNWSNNREFTKWCLTSPFNKMIGIEISNKIASFGACYFRKESDYVLLMNDGTISEYRRQGMQQYIMKERINRILKEKASPTIYANVEQDCPSHRNYSRIGFLDGPLYYVYA